MDIVIEISSIRYNNDMIDCKWMTAVKIVVPLNCEASGAASEFTLAIADTNRTRMTNLFILQQREQRNDFKKNICSLAGTVRYRYVIDYRDLK